MLAACSCSVLTACVRAEGERGAQGRHREKEREASAGAEQEERQRGEAGLGAPTAGARRRCCESSAWPQAETGEQSSPREQGTRTRSRASRTQPYAAATPAAQECPPASSPLNRCPIFPIVCLRHLNCERCRIAFRRAKSRACQKETATDSSCRRPSPPAGASVASQQSSCARRRPAGRGPRRRPALHHSSSRSAYRISSTRLPASCSLCQASQCWHLAMTCGAWWRGVGGRAARQGGGRRGRACEAPCSARSPSRASKRLAERAVVPRPVAQRSVGPWMHHTVLPCTHHATPARRWRAHAHAPCRAARPLG